MDSFSVGRKIFVLVARWPRWSSVTSYCVDRRDSASWCRVLALWYFDGAKAKAKALIHLLDMSRRKTERAHVVHVEDPLDRFEIGRAHV